MSEIHIETGLLNRAGAVILETFSPSRVHIVSDSTVAPLYLEKLEKQFSLPVTHTVIPPVRSTSSFPRLRAFTIDLLAAGMTRKDLTYRARRRCCRRQSPAFRPRPSCAACRCVRSRPTLLAQVDSSVGGKTGVDLPEGKNLVGAFYQPRLVLIDPNVLTSLPGSTFADGMAEVVKYGYISNREILTMVSQPDYKSNIENYHLRVR